MVSRRVEMHPDGDFLTARIPSEQLDFVPTRAWNPSPSVHHRTDPYDVPETVEIGVKST